MTSLLAAFLILMTPPGPVTQPWLDGSMTIGAAAGWFGLWRAEADLARAHCPCAPDDAPGFENWVVGHDAPTEAWADGVAALALALPLATLTYASPQTLSNDGLLVLESVALTGLITHSAKILVSRPYPYMFEADSDPARDGDSINYASMWSGHTAVPMAAAVTFAYVVSQHRPKWTWWAWTMGPALALTAGTLQVFAGNHFPSDVAAGAAVGASIGWLNPWLHEF